jgi:methylenetetrahydrofolate dehydrogenase (NAD+)
MADTGPDPAPAPAPKGTLLKADTVAGPFLAELKASLANSTSRSRPPKLVGILATANAPSRSYAEFTRKQCVGLGIEFELREVGAALGGREAGADGARADGTSNGDGVEEAIIEANADSTVDGIMVCALSCTFRPRRFSILTISDTPPGVLSNFRQGAGEHNTPPLGHRRLVIYA